MKFPKAFFVPVIVIAVSLFACIALRSVPVSRIWNSYSVVYVEKSVPERFVLDTLEKYGCSGILSLGQQGIPVASDFTPVLPGRMNDYLYRRLSYFSDESSSFGVYYVPRGNESYAVKALEEIVRETSARGGVDGRKQYPWIVPLIVCVMFGVFLFLSQIRIVFALSSIFMVVLSFSQPFYTVASSCLLYMLACCLASRIWGRKKAINVLRKNLYFLIPLGVAFVSIMLSGWQCLVLLLLCACSSYGLLWLLAMFEQLRDSLISFKVVKIFQAPQLPLMYTATAKHTLFCLFPLALVLAGFVLSQKFAPTADGDVSLPVPVVLDEVQKDSEDVLPSIDDYYKWSWNVQSFPYRSLNERYDGTVSENDSVVVPRYEVEDGFIVEKNSEIMRYDENFRDRSDSFIDELEYGAVEKLMKKQDRGVSVVYKRGSRGSQRTDGLGLVLVLASLFVPLVMLMIYMLKTMGRRPGKNK